MILESWAVSRDMPISPEKVCTVDWAEVVSFEQWDRFAIILVSCLSSHSMAVKGDLKLESLYALLEKTMRIN